MEFWIFLGVVFVVLVALLIRSRSGGTGIRFFNRDRHLEDGPINYGAEITPRGTSKGVGVNAPWFARTHGADSPKSHGPGE